MEKSFKIEKNLGSEENVLKLDIGSRKFSKSFWK